MSRHIARCENLWKAAYEYKDKLIADVAGEFCDDKIQRPYAESGLNYYDVSKPCIGDLCYSGEQQSPNLMVVLSVKNLLILIKS